MKWSNEYMASGANGVTQAPVVAGSAARSMPGPVAHRHHWSIYLVFASFSLLVAGLASDPRFQQIVREWFLSR